MSLQKYLSMIFEWSWELGEVLADWMLAHVVPIVKKGKKENLRNYRLASLISVSGKVKGENFLWGIEKHNNAVIHCARGKSGSSNLWSFYDKVDKGKPVDALFLDFS